MITKFQHMLFTAIWLLILLGLSLFCAPTSFAAKTGTANLPTIAQLAQNSTGSGHSNNIATTATPTFRPASLLLTQITPESGNWSGVPWTLDANGTLTLGSGTGTSTGGFSPWGSLGPSIQQIVIKGPVIAPADISDLFGVAPKNASIFQNLTKITGLENMDVSRVTNMASLFGTDPALTTISGMNNWDVSHVINLDNMFLNDSGLSDISALANWKTSKVQNMQGLFDGDSSLTDISALSGWDVSQVTTLDSTFANCFGLQNLVSLANWDTGNVTDLGGTFANCSNLTDISELADWHTSKNTSLDSTFENLSSVQDFSPVANWHTALVTDMADTFSRDGTGTTDLDLFNWQTGNVTTMAGMFWDSNFQKVTGLTNWDVRHVTTMYDMFDGSPYLTTISDLSPWQTTSLTNTESMFQGDSALTSIGDLANWDMSQVTDASHMFNQTSSLETIGDLSAWNTAKLTTLYATFDQTGLTSIGNLDNWHLNSLQDLTYAFESMPNLTSLGNLSKWATGNILSMNAAFESDPGLTTLGNISNWNTANVLDMGSMFAGTGLTGSIDLSGWNTGKVGGTFKNFNWDLNGTNGSFNNMFQNDSKITSLKLGSTFAIPSSVSDTSMLDGMSALRQITFGTGVVNSVGLPNALQNTTSKNWVVYWANVGNGTTTVPDATYTYDATYDGKHADTYVLQSKLHLQINVTGSDGQALAGAGLQITGPDGSVQTVTTNTSGQADVKNLLPGNYTVVQTSTNLGYDLPNSNNFPVTIDTNSLPATLNIKNNLTSLSLTAPTAIDFDNVGLADTGYHNIQQMTGKLAVNSTSTTTKYNVTAQVTKPLTNSTGTSELTQGIGYRTDANTVILLNSSPYQITASTNPTDSISDSWWSGSHIAANQIKGPVLNLTDSNRSTIQMGSYTGTIDWAVTMGPQ